MTKILLLLLLCAPARAQRMIQEGTPSTQSSILVSSLAAQVTMGGSLVVDSSGTFVSSVTASAFFGDGASLTGMTTQTLADVSSTAPAPGQIFAWSGSSWVPVSIGAVNLLGTGADGAVDVVAGSTLSLAATATLGYYSVSVATPIVPISIVIKNYTSLTIENGAALTVSTNNMSSTGTVQGIIIHCLGTVTVNGYFFANHGTPSFNGGTLVTSPNGVGVIRNVDYLLYPQVFTVLSSTGGGKSSGQSIVAAGGASGAGTSGAAGNGGAAASSATVNALLGISANDWANSVFLTGSASGNEGPNGGGGQPGGGFIYIFAKNIVVGSTGKISTTNPVGSNNGGNSGNVNSGGAGGGSGGLILLASPNPVINNGLITAPGGNGGSADNGSGGAGGAGGVNTTINGVPTAGAAGSTSASSGAGGGGGAGGIILSIGL